MPKQITVRQAEREWLRDQLFNVRNGLDVQPFGEPSHAPPGRWSRVTINEGRHTEAVWVYSTEEVRCYT